MAILKTMEESGLLMLVVQCYHDGRNKQDQASTLKSSIRKHSGDAKAPEQRDVQTKSAATATAHGGGILQSRDCRSVYFSFHVAASPGGDEWTAGQKAGR